MNTRQSAIQRRRVTAGAVVLALLAGGGWALASSGGGTPAAPAVAPNSGSDVPGATPQREVAVQPALAAQAARAKKKPAAP